MDYGALLKRSFDIAWRHRFLWLLALFAGEGGTGVGGFNSPRITAPYGPSSTPSGAAPDFRPFGEWVAAHVGLLVALGVTVVVLWIVLFLLSCACAAAVVRGAEALDRGEDVGLGGAWRLGLGRFGGVLRLRLLMLALGLLVAVGFAAIVAAIIVSAVLKAWVALVLAIYAGLSVMPLLFVVALVLPTLLRLALRAIVLDGLGAWAGLREGWGLIRRRLGPVAVLFAVEVAVGIAVAIVVGIAFGLILAPVAIAAFSAGGLGAAAVAAAAFAVILGVAAILVGAAVASFLSVLWTLGYRRLQAG